VAKRKAVAAAVRSAMRARPRPMTRACRSRRWQTSVQTRPEEWVPGAGARALLEL